MARVEGFELEKSGQEPVDADSNPVPVGVWGDSKSGLGVFGTSGELSPGVSNIPISRAAAGVEGHSIENSGVVGESIQGPGVFARSHNGSGLLGVTFSPTPFNHGVFGVSTASGNGVVGFVGEATGVIGNSFRGIGVHGVSESGIGIRGESVSSTGIVGTSKTAPGVFGSSDQEYGVYGRSNFSDGAVGVTTGSASGLNGLQFSGERGSGVLGVSVLGVGVDGFSFGDIGVRGESRNGYAGAFYGDVLVTGALSKAGGGFKIDHPLDPENKYLCHSFVESPDMLNVYSGIVNTDGEGMARVTLPDYFEALNQDFRYQLTVIGQFAQAIVAEEISNNQFMIKTDRPKVKVSWQITGIRHDPWATASRIAVEQEKSAEEKGRYMHPKPCGQPEEVRLHRAPQHEDHIYSACQLLPEQVRRRVEQYMRKMLQGAPFNRQELHDLVMETRKMMHHQEEQSKIDRTRLNEEWQLVEELVQEIQKTI